MAENMNTECANKLLKLIEEPSRETVFLLLTENKSAILPTIKSRCQEINIPPIDTKEIAESLIKKGVADNEKAYNTANMSGGSYCSALKLLSSDSGVVNFESVFIEWVRLAFKVKTSKSAVAELVNWSEKVSKLPKDVQKQFFLFSLEIFRKSLLKNYKSGSYGKLFKDKSFKFEKFVPYIHDNNIIELYEEINKAIYELNRNGNAKIIVTDLSLKLTRLIHQKASVIDG